jgi:type II secretory pathway predicted ATPase ExeA
VFLNYKLRPLTLEETKNYIAHRLKVSGSDKQLFSDEVLSLIYDRTGGIPRRINNICNLALLEAFSANKDTVDEECVNEALNTQGE